MERADLISNLPSCSLINNRGDFCVYYTKFPFVCQERLLRSYPLAMLVDIIFKIWYNKLDAKLNFNGGIIPMNDIKNGIERLLEKMASENEKKRLLLNDRVMLTDYMPENGIWTRALQSALNEHEVVIIPSSSEPYILDGSVTVLSNRRIIAEKGAIIRLKKDTRVLMLRNTNTADGTHAPIIGVERNVNITIEGGIWEECCTHRMGYGSSGMYDEERSFFGVSTCMLLENVDGLTLKDLTFRNCGGFAVQLGEIRNAVIENIRFENCFADGIHVNGNTENIRIRNVAGEVGDDLVAFNMFDWQNSSINFGPCNNVICEDLVLSPKSHYKALRIEPGIYTFDDGTRVDCSLTNAIFRRISNIKTFKLYCQTPVYFPNEEPESADVGSGDNIFFEDISVELDEPIDKFDDYMNGNEIIGSFAAFELGLNVKNIYFKNIELKLHKEKFPCSYFACIGPKSIRLDNGAEVFDPYFSSVCENFHFENVKINGKKIEDITPYVKEIVFDGLYEDIASTAFGKINRIINVDKNRS